MVSGQPHAWNRVILPISQRHKLRLGQQYGPFQCEASGSQSSVLLVCHGGNCEGQMPGRDPQGAWAWTHWGPEDMGPVFLRAQSTHPQHLSHAGTRS